MTTTLLSTVNCQLGTTPLSLSLRNIEKPRSLKAGNRIRAGGEPTLPLPGLSNFICLESPEKKDQR